ncbi:MAG: hypothetical protein JWM59_2857 [Verrucomicrobiales bacterium]|nr:hypothetical protein [Verrucomicrobiales bacterium]
MPTRSQLLTTAAVVSLLTFGIIRYACGDAADGTASSAPAGLSRTRFSGVPANPPGGRHLKRSPGPGAEGFPSNPGDSHNAVRSPPLGITNSGRGIFQPAGSSAEHSRNSQAADSWITPPAAAGNVSEAELQWRAARVEQEANHELKRLVALLDLDRDQQDRIFQTLARRSTDWHPLMQPSTVSGGGGHGVADNGSIINQRPSSTTTGSGETSSPRDPGTFIAPPQPAPDSAQAHNDSPAAGSQPGSGTPLTEDLAPDLTPAQQEELAEDEMQRQEWWESIIPRLLPDEEDGEIYAAPPDAATDGTPDNSIPPSQ